MKIALIAPTFLPARRANTIQVMKMAQAITRNGMDVIVFVPDYQPDSQKNSGERSRENLQSLYGLTVRFPVEWISAKRVLRRYDYGLSAVLRGKKAGADVVYTRLPQAAVIASNMGMKTVYELHDMPSTIAGKTLLRLFLRSRHAAKLICISQRLCDDIRKAFDIPERVPVLVAPDGIDAERYENLPAAAQARARLQAFFPEAGFQKDVFTAGYTGHLYRGRGIGILKQLALQMPDVQFLVAGGEPEAVEDLRIWCREKGANNFFVAGFVNNDEIPLVQAACDTLLMPYQKQIAASSGGDIARYLSPMKLFEYMASGRPIISSDLPVIREVLTANNAVLLPPDDVDAWQLAIRRFMKSPEEAAAIGMQAKRDVSVYSWRKRAALIFEDWIDADVT